MEIALAVVLGFGAGYAFAKWRQGKTNAQVLGEVGTLLTSVETVTKEDFDKVKADVEALKAKA